VGDLGGYTVCVGGCEWLDGKGRGREVKDYCHREYSETYLRISISYENLTL